MYPDLNQQALLDNNKIIYYLSWFYAAVSCGLAIDTPVPSEDHIVKDPPRQHLNICRRQQFFSSSRGDPQPATRSAQARFSLPLRGESLFSSFFGIIPESFFFHYS